MTRTSLTLTWLTLFTLCAACASTPAIPEGAAEREQQMAYRSTADADEASPEAVGAPAQPEAVAQPEPQTTPQASSQAPQREMRATGPVAVVNGEEITAEIFNAQLAQITSSGQVPPHLLTQLEGERRREFKAQIVQDMVMRLLLKQKLRAQNFEVSDAQIDAKLKEMQDELDFAKKMGAADYGTIEEMTAQMGMSTEQLRESVRQTIELEQLVRSKYAYSEASREEARAYYEEHKDTFNQTEQVRARHILIRVRDTDDERAWADARARIGQLRERAVASDGDFASLAREHSEDGNKAKGGDLGYFHRGKLDPDFEQAVFAMKDGEISAPVRTKFGWHLIKREGYRPAGAPPFELMETQIARQLTMQRFQRSLKMYLEEVREAAKIQVNLDNIT